MKVGKLQDVLNGLRCPELLCFLPLLLVASSVVHSCKQQRQEYCLPGDCGKGNYCLAGVCFETSDDPDGDGLEVGIELEWGFDPLDPDSDHDGFPDGTEWGIDNKPLDSDGDGVPDGLESAIADADNDCIADQYDQHNYQPDLDFVQTELKAIVCPNSGVCATHYEILSVECQNGYLFCSIPPFENYEDPEVSCDGIDNDCDGMTDEELFFGLSPGEPCLELGQCGQGVVECNLETKLAVCSTGPEGSGALSVPEICDRLDNDCDGFTDEDYTYLGIPIGAPCNGVGACGEGVVECTENHLAANCSSNPGQSEDQSHEELCDGKDNDCDGLVDNGLTLEDKSICPLTGVCLEGIDLLKVVCIGGIWTCDAQSIPMFNTAEEYLCDGLDNDCDGFTDESFVFKDYDGLSKGIGQNCGTGYCLGGKVICAPDGSRAVCSTLYNASTEVCDNADNDCDGQTDEGMTYQGKQLGESCLGVGLCGPGIVECSLVTLTATCSSNPDGSSPQNSEEKCDLLDNDCDGLTDEGLFSEAQECSLLGVCQGSQAGAVCKWGEWLCDYSGVENYEPAEITCDELDNDCDGWTDEGTSKKFVLYPVQIAVSGPPSLEGVSWTFDKNNAKVVAFGGRGRPYPYAGEFVYSNSFWEFSSDTMKWEEVGTAPLSACAHGTLTWLGATGYIYIGGVCDKSAPAVWKIGSNLFSFQNLIAPQSVAARSHHSAIYVKAVGKLWVVGGWIEQEFQPWVRYDPTSDSWDFVSDSPPVASATAVEIPNGVFVFGGKTMSGLTNQAFIINLQGEILTYEVDSEVKPQPRFGASAAVIGNKVVLFGGKNDHDVLGDTWILDIETGKWQKGSAGPPAAWNSIMVPYDNGVVLITGISKQGTRDNEIWYFDGAQWSLIQGNDPTVVVAAASAINPSSGDLCMYGGFRTGLDSPVPNSGLWCKDTDTAQWKLLATTQQQPLAYSTMSYDSYHNRFIITGGTEITPGEEPNPFLTSTCHFLIYDLDTGQWVDNLQCQENEPLWKVSAHASVEDFVQAKIYFSGGTSPEGLRDSIWVYDMASGDVQIVTVSPPIQGRYGHGMYLTSDGSHLILLGGNGEEEAGADVVAIDIQSGTWTVLFSASWLNVLFPITFMDSPPDQLLLAGSGSDFVTRLVFQGQTMIGEEAVPAFPGLHGVSLSLTWFSSRGRFGIATGGLTNLGLASTAVWRFNTTCSEQ